MDSTLAPQHFPSTWIANLLTTLASDTRGDPLLNHQEGHYNLAVCNVLLKLGATLQFGTVDSDLADYLSIATGWSNETRLHKLSAGSGDITITSPGVLCLELKCRPDYGPKAQAKFPDIADDLDRIATERSTAFLFSFDERLYGSFDGSANKTKPSTTGDLLRAFFPKANELTVDVVYNGRLQWGTTPIDAWVLKVETAVKKRRVFVFGRAA